MAARAGRGGRDLSDPCSNLGMSEPEENAAVTGRHVTLQTCWGSAGRCLYIK